MEKLVVNKEDKPQIKADKNDIINALIRWHDLPGKKDIDTEGKEIIFNFYDYEPTLRMALDDLLLNKIIDQKKASEIVSYLSDGKVKTYIH